MKLKHKSFPAAHAVRLIAFVISVRLLCTVVPAALYTREGPLDILRSFGTLLTSPCPLVTDYFRLASLPATYLNAGLCGLACFLLMLRRDAQLRPSVWAGYFLVIAHCFYGLNLLNMWPPLLGFFVYCRVNRLRLRDHLDRAMFITAFAPFVSEILFRYPFAGHLDIVLFGAPFNLVRVLWCVLFSLFVGFTLPAMLTATAKWHRGFNLYNAGLATGLLGLFLYAFMYRTMGETPAGPLEVENAAYAAHGESYGLFIVAFYVLLFATMAVYGWLKNGMSFRGYRKLLRDSGHGASFLEDYGSAVTLINFGLYGLMVTGVLSAIILLTDGAGFTGATCGIIFAAMTFSAAGQHPRNVAPIFAGYALLSLTVHALCLVTGRPIPWTLSTQGYMNALAFATGLCPVSGKYGWRLGVAAGFVSAVLCTTTSALHGGFVLYNGGLTAGLSALLLLPMLDAWETRREKRKD